MALLNQTKIEIAPKGTGEIPPASWKTLPACISLPDFGTDPEYVPTTTLDDLTGTNELGVGEAGDVMFEFRYRTEKVGANEPSFKTLSGLTGVINTNALHVIRVTMKSGLVVEFDVSGVSVKILGGGVNDVSNFQASFGLASGFTFTEEASGE